MKRSIILLAAFAVLLPLPSCRFIRVNDSLKEEIKEEIKEKAEEEGITWKGESGGASIVASDNYISRDEVTGSFHSLSCNLPGEITYIPGDCALSINAPDNVLEHVTVRNEGGTLVIKSDLNSIRKLKKITINLSCPVLESLTFNGAVDFNAPQGITALDFDATVNGAGDIRISGLQAGKASMTVNGAGDAQISSLDCDDLRVSINGAGDARISGKSASAQLSISGAGDIDARSLACPDIQSKVHGVGKIRKPNT